MVQLKPSAAQSFALLIHELATNAGKYGALSTPGGNVAISWSIHRNGRPILRFTWRERGGPAVAKPSHKGFGTTLLEHAIGGLDSSPTIDFTAEGLVYETRAELSTIQPITGRSHISRVLTV